jgi:hypothetical protein
MPQIVCFGIVKLLYEGKAQDETPGVYGGIHRQQPKLWGREGPPTPTPTHSQKILLGFKQVCSFVQIARVSKNKVKKFDFSFFAFSLKIFIFAKKHLFRKN